jgi:hypothetical protein
MKSKTVLLASSAVIVLLVIVLGAQGKFGGVKQNQVAQVADATPPVVSITEPLNGAVVSGSQVRTCASATDNVGITSISFRFGGIPAGGTTSPLCQNVNSVNFANGFYTVFGTATDAAGNTTTSPVSTVAVLNSVQPIVVTDIPAKTSTVSGMVTVTARAYSTSAVQKVDFKLDGSTNIIGTAISPSSPNTYTFVWDSSTTTNGSHNITSMVTDTSGRTAVAGNTFMVQNTITQPDISAPTVNLGAPTSGTTVSGTIQVSATANDDVAVDHIDFYNGTTLVGADAQSPFSINLNTTTFANGTYSLTARAYDAAGNNATSNAVVVIINNTIVPPADTTAPTVSITTPAAGASVAGTNVTLIANAADGTGVTRVEFYRGATLISTDTTASPNYEVAWNTSSLSNGSYTLTAKAYDAAGNVGTSSATQVTVANPVPDTTAPTVSVSAPTSNQRISGQFTVAANASDNVGVTRVEFYRGSTLIGIDTTAPFDYVWDTTAVAAGTYSIKAKAFDAANNTKTSNGISAIVSDVIAPVVTITRPTSTTLPSSGTVSVTATASDLSGIKNIKIMVDGVQKKQCTSGTSCTYAWSMSGVGAGNHTITATAQDKATTTNTGTATKTVTK